MTKNNDNPKQTLIPFFIITFLFSWFFWLIAVLASFDFFTLPINKIIFVGIGAHGPLVSALWLTGRKDGWTGIKRLIRSGFDLRLSLYHWLLILLLPIVLAGLAVRLNMYMSPFHPDVTLLNNPLFILPVFLFMFFLGGSVQEEFGWRGFALPRLLKKWNPLWAALFLGLIWGVWHFPLFYISTLSQSYMNFGLFILLTLCFSLLMTHLYLQSDKNLFTALLFHTAVNTSLSLFPPIEQKAGGNQHAFTLMTLFYILVTAVVIIKERKTFFKAKEAHHETVV
ncbi:CPBP family intramembrane glutamic endopeptidase [Fidelibacter multiformis]|uniref:CPBP family intramembrane glutamic endopeptidase n=1 Tax=Fidelibacter multiformis TaxID=3377529 RepID=UPI0037DDA585